MTFRTAFFRTLSWRPLQALAGLYWHLTRRKVRARNRLRMGAAQAPYAYDFWIDTIEDNIALAAQAPTIVEGWQYRPTFSIVLHVPEGAPRNQIERTIESVKKQIYPGWELIMTGGKGNYDEPTGHHDARLIALTASIRSGAHALEVGIAAASGDFLVPLRLGQLLSPAALFRFSEALQEARQASIIYGDQDEIDLRGKRIRPWFKPHWDEEMFLAQDYVSEACALDLRLAQSALPLTEPCDEAVVFALLLAVSKAAPGPIVHVPFVISHVEAGLSRPSSSARAAAVNRHLEPVGAISAAGPFDTVKVDWPLPDNLPGVSIIIPTRDKVDLLRACVDSVLNSTNYLNFELIIADNGSTEAATISYLSEISRNAAVRVISFNHPYNYSAINNFAVRHATAPYLCLLNNDTEVIREDWLLEMMRYAVRPEVGAVGAKLLYEDGTIQHAGVVIGICEAAGHAHRFARSDEPGYFSQPHIAHVVSAVTAACLVVEKSKFEAVGGLDAEGFPVAFNDVDFCLKLERAGWRNVYVPHAVLLHYESKSRGLDTTPAKRGRYLRELAALQERWGTKHFEDPRHNLNLDRYSETFILRL